VILQDPYGEVSVPFGQYFRHENAILCVVCPDSKLSTPLKPVICVRLISGFIENDGKRFAIPPDGRQPLFPFAGDLVASRVRAYRLTDELPGMPDSFDLIKPPTGAYIPRASVSKERAEQYHPTTESLFG
jgi:hypothetical protein